MSRLHEIFRQATKLGMPINAKLIDRLITTLQLALHNAIVEGRNSSEITALLQDLKSLAVEMDAIEASEVRQHSKVPEVRRPITQEVRQALDKSLSNAAAGSLHDSINAKHRPGGKIMPRPRWSVDEAPLSGWDDGEPVIEVRQDAEVRQPSAIGDWVAEMMAECQPSGEVRQPETEAPEESVDVRQSVADIFADCGLDATAKPVHRLSRKAKKFVKLQQRQERRPAATCRRPLPWLTMKVRAVLRCSNCNNDPWWVK